MSLWNALPAALALLLAGCATAYERPTGDEPHATITYRRSYDPVDAQSLRESIGERLWIDQHVAYEATSHAAFARGARCIVVWYSRRARRVQVLALPTGQSAEAPPP